MNDSITREALNQFLISFTSPQLSGEWCEYVLTSVTFTHINTPEH